MFYSHEILTSRQHGVATVWVLATLGESCANRRLSRKAIQDVDVPKACVTIDEPPGAPIALRLQASLLYGVSKAYHQQCKYVLGDVTKFRASMAGILRILATGTLDKEAATGKKQQIMVEDDPKFHIADFWDLPPLNLDQLVNRRASKESQNTVNNYSYLSPLNRSQSLSSARNPINLDFDPMSFSGDSVGFDSPFAGGSSVQKPAAVFDPFDENLNPEDMAFGDLFQVDADGNIIPEPELPQLPGPDAGAIVQPNAPEKHSGDNFIPPMSDDQPLLNLADEPLPDAEALPVNHDVQPQPDDQVQDKVAATAPAERRKRRRKGVAPDTETKIGSLEFRSWGVNYLHNMEQERARVDKRRDMVTKEQAANSAYQTMFGHGIGGVGSDLGIHGFQHPLADLFAGHGLQKSLFGRVLGENSESQRRRRSASVAFGEDSESGEEGRRVRPRTEDADQSRHRLSQDAQDVGQAVDEDMIINFDNADLLPEIGRDPGHPLSDQPVAPWHRHSSLMPGSSIKGSTAKRNGGHGPKQVQESPLQRRGSVLQDIERFSDDHFDGGGGFESMDDGSSLQHHCPGLLFGGGDKASAGGSTGHVSGEGREFLAYLKHEARAKGSPRSSGDELWVDFEELVPPKRGSRTQAIAAQAFYQILCLTTSRTIKVDQEGRDRDDLRPFGPIQVGVCVNDDDVEEDTLDHDNGGDGQQASGRDDSAQLAPAVPAHDGDGEVPMYDMGGDDQPVENINSDETSSEMGE